MPLKRSPHHVRPLPGDDRAIDPAAEYRRATGRDPDFDAMPGALLAAVPYLNDWLGHIFKEVLGDLEVGYRPTLGTTGLAEISPLPGWVRSALELWAIYAQRAGIPDEKLTQAGLPPLSIINDFLAKPPLRLSLSYFRLARGLFIEGSAVIRGDMTQSLSTLLEEPVRDLLRLGATVRPDLGSEYHTSDVTLELLLRYADDARALIARVRQVALKPRTASGPARDLPARAFHHGTVTHRLPDKTDARHLALLEAVAGIAVIKTRTELNQAIRKWCNRAKRFASIGPVPDLPQVPVPPAGSENTSGHG
jgi:hypothetical protein